MKKILTGLAATLALSTSAMAADLVYTPVEPAPIGEALYDWSGFYIGLGGGTGLSVTDIGIPPLAGAEFSGLGGEGVFGEATIGYDYMFDNRFVLGVYGTATYGNIGPHIEYLGLSADANAEYGFNALARLGYAWSPRSMVYVLGGYSWEHFKISTSPSVFSADWDSNGWVAGIGVETVLKNRLTWKSEYRYNQYQTNNPFGPLVDVDSTVHTFHTSLVYRFNGGLTDTIVEPVNYNWTGLKIGGAIGSGGMIQDTSALFGAGSLNGIGGHGFFGDLTLGYDREFGSNWVGGVILAGRYSSISTDLSVGPFSASLDGDYGFDALARVGYRFGGRTLGYVLGGYSWQHFDISTSPPVFNYDWGANGLTIGSGVETPFTEKLTGFAEYRYTWYDTEDFNTGGLIETNPRDHTFRVGLKYKLF